MPVPPEGASSSPRVVARVPRSTAPGNRHHRPVREMSRGARTPPGSAAFPQGGVACNAPRLHVHERAGDCLQVSSSASGRSSSAIFVPMLNWPIGPGGVQRICWRARRFTRRRRTPMHASCLRFVPLVDLDRSRNLTRNPRGRPPRCRIGFAGIAQRWQDGRRCARAVEGW